MVRVSDRRERTADRRVELNVRSLASRTGDGVQERAVEALRRLEADGAVASFAVRVWGEQVGLSTTAVETERGQEVLERVGAFRAWANRNGVSLEPFFDARATTSRITGEEYTVLCLPVAAMAEYEGGDLAYVTPHEDDGVVRTVGGRLDVLSEQGVERADGPLAPDA